MRAQPFLPRRRSVRLPQFDYAQPGYYFLTICAKNMNGLFGQINGNDVQLSPIGRITDECWRSIPTRFAGVELGPHIVMPDHVHGVVIIRPPTAKEPDTTSVPGAVADGTAIAKEPRRARCIVPLQPTVPAREFGVAIAGSIATIVATFKAGVTREIGRRLGPSASKPFWQRGYYEHIIRDDRDFGKICEYIRTNPIRRTFKNEFHLRHVEPTKRAKP